MSLDDIIDDAQEELKRVEHLVFVSLKYTRTVDVLKNVLNRMIEAYNHMLKALYKNKRDDEPPEAPVKLANTVNTMYDEEIVGENVELYLLLRKILRAPNPIKEEEYRRHVAMKTFIDGKEEVFNIDLAMQYFETISEFFETLRRDILDYDG
jgi:hypothetical protein